MTEHTEISAYPDPGELPVLDWLDVGLIDVDPMYQRPCDPVRVSTIASGFNWRSFGALVVVPVADGRYHVTDGQHRLQAAKAHPNVDRVPCVIVEAENVRSEASIFVEINASRKNVSALELFFARLATDDEDAETIRQVCERAGVRIPKYPSAGFKPGDSVAVGSIQAIIGRRGAMRARQMLEILVKAACAPISANQIKAVELLMTDSEFAGWLDPDELTTTIRTMGNLADAEAKRFAATHSVPAWKGLANIWFQKCRKRRTPAKTGSQTDPVSIGLHKNPVGAAAGPLPTHSKRVRTVAPHSLPAQRNVTAAICGDPPAGRSALDRRVNANDDRQTSRA